MEATVNTRSNDLLLLCAVVMLSAISYMQLSAPYYLPTSKIEEGTVVQRNDSVTTVIIPDIR